MADLYTVRFAVNSEPSDARFEFMENAKAFADRLAFAGTAATVTDEFADRDENPVYEAEPDPLPNGVYQIADTPPQAAPLAVEDGSGDHGILLEALAEQEVPVDVEAVQTASVLDVEGEAVVAIKGTEGVTVRIGVPEDMVEPFKHTVREAGFVYGDDAEPDDALIG